MIEVPVKIALPAPRAVRLTVLLARVCAVPRSAIGALVLGGWLFDLSAPERSAARLPGMAPECRRGVLAAGLGLFCLTFRVLRPIGWLIGLHWSLLGMVSVSQDLFGFDLGLDQALFAIATVPVSSGGWGQPPWRQASPDR